MKKLFLSIIIFMIFMQYHSVFASNEFTVEGIDLVGSYPKPLTFEERKAPEFNEINGVKYMWESLKLGCHPLKYDPVAYRVLKEAGLDDCIWTGEYYMARSSSGDSLGPRYKSFNNSPVKFFDKDFNFIRELRFKGYPDEIGYQDGTYYCIAYATDGRGMFTSTDTIKWVKAAEEDRFMPQKLGSVLYKPIDIDSKFDKSFSIKGSDSYSLIHENRFPISYGRRWGEFVFVLGHGTIYLSNDNIYYVEVKIPEFTDPKRTIDLKIIYTYEYGDDIIFDAVVDGKEGYRLRTPKQPIYDELARAKNSPYVVVNDTILGFTQPPVIEDDRTLVPMRFMFEQMGANVDWNSDTQTATVRGNEKEIAFSINSTEANVDGSIKTMDVPARLVNGKTMVPLRFLSEGLGYTVQWDENTKIASIKTE